jgi:hypothetical protein
MRLLYFWQPLIIIHSTLDFTPSCLAKDTGSFVDFSLSGSPGKIPLPSNKPFTPVKYPYHQISLELPLPLLEGRAHYRQFFGI